MLPATLPHPPHARPLPMSTQTQTQAPGGALGNYIVEVRKEMRKVNWPKRKELMSNTTLTLVAALVISIFIFGADQVISQVLQFVYGG